APQRAHHAYIPCCSVRSPPLSSKHPPPPSLYTLSLHDALPIFVELDLSGDSTQRFTSTTTLSFSAVPGASTFVDLVDGELSSIRSEEHTSELQSRFDLVCRLLLEKKKRGRLGSWQDSCEGTRG